MAFVALGRAVAWIALLAGLAGVVLGLVSAMGMIEMSGARSPAKQVYDGLMTGFYGLVIGLLAEIAHRLDRNRTE